MRVLGCSDLGKRAQQAVRGDPRFLDILAVEDGGVLFLYQPVRKERDPAWSESYAEWAKLTPVHYDLYRLDHKALSGEWQELDVERSLEECVLAIVNNKYHLFFM